MTNEEILIEELSHGLMHILGDIDKDEFDRKDRFSALYTLNHCINKIDLYYKKKKETDCAK
jgi:hypothetical protein